MRRKSFRVRDRLIVLLDQNVPRAVASWLRSMRPAWMVHHTSDVGLSGHSDEAVFSWAVQHNALIITFDEDFADGRSFPAREHHGIVSLRVWPTTTEETQQALDRLFREVSDDELSGALVIVGPSRIRIRSRPT
jgi:predicted nuclease of predicted toxin-antitoxin system